VKPFDLSGRLAPGYSIALQMCPFSADLEFALARRFEMARWFELDAAAKQQLLDSSAADIRAVVTSGSVGCPVELMHTLPALGVIVVNGVGLDKVDLDVARQRGIAVGSTPGILSEDVADLAVGLIIALLRDIPGSDAHVKSGAWPGGERPLGRKVSGRRFGIVGLGQIGLAIARRLAPFGPVSWTGPHAKSVAWPQHPDVLCLARCSDVLVVACPANPATRHLVNSQVIEALGPHGYIVNISRGAVVDESALARALAGGRLAGAALDVFENEPHVPESLRQLPNTVLTPHMASATHETRKRMADLVLAHLDDFLEGRPISPSST
jgi:lactate dehydrogenase-like 2-hydroxyacid dehydrogenase